MKMRLYIGGLLGLVLINIAYAGPGDGWKEVKSRHFIVYYKNTPADFAEEVIESAEGYYDQITGDLGFRRSKGWSFDDRARIYIFDDQQDYVLSSRQSHWSAGAAYYNQRTIKTYPSETGFFDSLLPHELGHIIFHEFIGVKTRIPTWFSEGIAMYQERAKRWGSHQKVRQAIADGTFMPLEVLHRKRLTHDSSREEVELYYAQAASIVYFLIEEQGDFRFSMFCRKLQEGYSFMNALQKTYPRFESLDDLERAWIDYLKGD